MPHIAPYCLSSTNTSVGTYQFLVEGGDRPSCTVSPKSAHLHAASTVWLPSHLPSGRHPSGPPHTFAMFFSLRYAAAAVQYRDACSFTRLVLGRNFVVDFFVCSQKLRTWARSWCSLITLLWSKGAPGIRTQSCNSRCEMVFIPVTLAVLATTFAKACSRFMDPACSAAPTLSAPQIPRHLQHLHLKTPAHDCIPCRGL